MAGPTIIGVSMKVSAMRVKSVLKFFSFFSDGTGYPNLKIGGKITTPSLRIGFPTRCVITFCEGYKLDRSSSHISKEVLDLARTL